MWSGRPAPAEGEDGFAVVAAGGAVGAALAAAVDGDAAGHAADRPGAVTHVDQPGGTSGHNETPSRTGGRAGARAGRSGPRPTRRSAPGRTGGGPRRGGGGPRRPPRAPAGGSWPSRGAGRRLGWSAARSGMRAWVHLLSGWGG